MSEQKVQVYIEATERVRYSKVVEMPLAEFNRLEKQLGARGVDERVFGLYIDVVEDWMDADGQELEEFRLAEDEELLP